MAKSIFIRDQRTEAIALLTSNDIVVLSNAQGVTDAGQIVINACEAGFGLLLSSSDAKLTVGGNYHFNSSPADQCNIYVNSNIAADNPVIVSKKYFDTVGAAHFAGDGTLVLASQTGYVNTKIKGHPDASLSDEQMKFSASRKFATSSAYWNTVTYGPLPTVTNVYTFEAEKTLTINGSLTGIFSASNSIDLAGGYLINGESRTLVDNVSNQQLNSAVFKAQKIVLTGNVTQSLSATNQADLTAIATPSVSGNTITAAVFSSEEFEMQGIWGGNSEVQYLGGTIDATAKEAMSSVASASATNNLLTAKVVGANIVNINEIGDAAGVTGGTLSSVIQDVLIEAKSGSGTTAATSSSLSNNTVEAVTVDGSTLNIGVLNAAADLQADISGVTLHAGKTKSDKQYTETFTSNTVGAVVLRGDDIAVGDLYGKLSASMADVEIKQSLSLSDNRNNKANVAGIYSSGNLYFAGMMEGEITVVADEISVSDGPSETSIYISGIGGNGTMTVDGIINTDISVTASGLDTPYLVTGIDVNRLTADAFGGTIALSDDGGSGVGLLVRGTLNTSVSGDYFDINGTILTDYIGVASFNTLNLRISGTIIAGDFAVLSEHYPPNSVWYIYNDIPQDDVVELSSTAKVTGDIELARGKNTLILDSMAQLDGSMLASEGALNVRFILGQAQEERAVVEGAGKSDATIASTHSIDVDLNYAVNGGKYILIQYADADAEADDAWFGDNAKQTVSFHYNGEFQNLTFNKDAFVNGGLEFNVSGATAYLRYDKNNHCVYVDTISGIEAKETFDAVIAEKCVYDSEKRTATVVWGNTFKNAIAYEVEYNVVNRNGDKCGESVLVHLNDVKNNFYTIRNVDADQYVTYSVRRIDNGSSSNPTQWSTQAEINPSFASVTGVVYDENAKTVTVTWDKTQKYGFSEICYELEYTIGEESESTTVTLSGNTSSYTITDVTADSVTIRMRGKDQNSEYEPTDWSGEFVVTAVTPVQDGDILAPSFDGKKTKVIDTTTGSQWTWESAEATFSWEAPESDRLMLSYTIEVYETNDKVTLTDEEKSEGKDYLTKVNETIANASDNKYTKTVTNTEAVFSGMQHLRYVYWRITGTDVDGKTTQWIDCLGNTSAYLPGMCDDKDVPVFGDTTTSYEISGATVTAQHEKLWDVTFSWSAATDGQGGCGVRCYTLEYTLTSDTDWENAESIVVFDEDGKSDYSYTATNIPCGEYIYRIKATDSVGNESAYIGNETLGDRLNKEGEKGYEPVFSGGTTTSATPDPVKESSIYTSVKFTWDTPTDQGIDPTGICKYELTYKGRNQTESTTITIYSEDVANDLETGKSSYTYTLETPLACDEYVYSIKAYDYVGNVSTELVGGTFGDGVAPKFPEETANAEVVYVYQDHQAYQDLTFVWATPTDFGIHPSGVQRYELQYMVSSETDWTGANTVTIYSDDPNLTESAGVSRYHYTAKKLAANEYKFRLKAIDYAEYESDYVTGAAFGDRLNKEGEKGYEPVFSGGTTTSATPDPVKESSIYTSVTFTWDTPTDQGIDPSGICKYELTYKDSRLQEAVWSKPITIYADQTVSSQGTTTYQWKDLSLACGAYNYRLVAYDYVGNVSNSIEGFFGDDIAPEFITVAGRDSASVYYTEDSSSIGKIYYNLQFVWNIAVDNEGGSGVREYLIQYTSSADTGWAQATTISVAPKDVQWSEDQCSYITRIDGGQYQYRILAVDFAGNTSSSIGNETFGNIDVTPPDGQFLSVSTPVISVTYSEINEENDSGEIESKTVIEDASVTFSWSDSYKDDSDIYYWLEFSDTDTFASDKTYVYSTKTARTGSSNTYTIGNDLPTEPVGIFSLMKTVYWRIMAYDSFGNVTGIYSPTQSFKFVDSDDNKIKHLSGPDRPFDLSVSIGKEDGCYTKDVTINWYNNHTDLGILTYDLNVTSKDGGDNFTYTFNKIIDEGGEGSASHITWDMVNTDTWSELADGTYSWTITAKNAAGSSAKSSSNKFVLDTTRPTDVDGMKAEAMVQDVKISWDASYDRFGIASYELQYRLKDTSTWNTVAVTSGTSTTLYGLLTGEYEYRIYAFDVNGNISENAALQSFTVSLKEDLCDYYLPLMWENYDSYKPQGIEQSVGANDIADYFYIAEKEKAFSLTVNIKDFDLVSGKKSGISVALYKYDGSGKEKAISTVKTSNAKNGIINGKLLEAGTYFFKVTSQKQDSIENYNLTLSMDKFEKANQQKDDSAAEADKIASISMKNSVSDEWVGFSDLIDYRKIALDYAGMYDFSLSGLNSSTQLVLTVWQKKSNGKLSSVKKLTVKGSSKAAINDLLMDSANSYYVSVEAKKGKKGECSDYNLVMSGEEFTKANTEDDDWKKLPDVYTLCSGGSITGEWVGYGDLIDYREIELSASGEYDFSLSGLNSSTQLVLTVWQDKGNGKLSSVKKLTVKGSSKAAINDLQLDSANSYYVSVEAKKGKKGECSDYKLSMSGDWTPVANNSDDTWAQAAAQESPFKNSTTLRDWVGQEDTVDFLKIEVTEAGNFDLKLDLGSSAEVTFYRANGNALQEVSENSLSAGIYALKVETSQAAVSYQVEFDNDKKLLKAQLA